MRKLRKAVVRKAYITTDDTCSSGPVVLSAVHRTAVPGRDSGVSCCAGRPTFCVVTLAELQLPARSGTPPLESPRPVGCTDVLVLGVGGGRKRYRLVGRLATDPEARVRFPALPEKKVVGLERGSLSLMSTTDELLDRKVAAPV
jgi:hypothetical protein